MNSDVPSEASVSDQPAEVRRGATPGPERVASVDALRGFDMFWIVGGQAIVLALVGLFWEPHPGMARRTT